MSTFHPNPYSLLVQKKKSYRSKQNNKRQRKKFEIPPTVQAQNELRKKYRYVTRVLDNGNVENNSTLYVNTGVAHPHQVMELFNKAIEEAKNIPDIFGEDFECDVQINVVKKQDGSYIGYAFVDVTNPAFYYALIGCNPDGTDRAEYIDDPEWIPPSTENGSFEDESFEMDFDKPMEWGSDSNWADSSGGIPEAPKIRKALPPLISLGTYLYEPEQREFLDTDELEGTVSISPAFITPGVDERCDDRSLYISEIPTKNLDFLYSIFARYVRDENIYGNQMFPKISIKENERKKPDGTVVKNIFAIIKYSHPYDAAFALTMLKKIRANYEGKDIVMPVRYAYRTRY